MFTDDIERIRTQAHDANVANKIIDSLKGLQQSSDEKAAADGCGSLFKMQRMSQIAVEVLIYGLV